MKRKQHSFFIVLLTFTVFLLTNNPITRPFSLQMLLLSLLVFVIMIFLLKKKNIALVHSTKFHYLLIVTVLFLVGVTGWYFSPFFFTLYLLAIMLSFVFSSFVSCLFAITLAVLFSFNVGEVDLAYDILVILSFLTVIPLSYYLRKEYVKLKNQQDKFSSRKF